MPKIRKDAQAKQKRLAIKQNDMNILKMWMFESSGITLILTAICLTFAILFNTSVLVFPNPNSTTLLKVVNILLRGVPIILEFFFGMVALGNLFELSGEIMKGKHVIILALFCILQGVTDDYVVLIAIIGVISVYIYIYFMQTKIGESEETEPITVPADSEVSEESE